MMSTWTQHQGHVLGVHLNGTGFAPQAVLHISNDFLPYKAVLKESISEILPLSRLAV